MVVRESHPSTHEPLRISSQRAVYASGKLKRGGRDARDSGSFARARVKTRVWTQRGTLRRRSVRGAESNVVERGPTSARRSETM